MGSKNNLEVVAHDFLFISLAPQRSGNPPQYRVYRRGNGRPNYYHTLEEAKRFSPSDTARRGSG